jgi:cyclic pyranopterin phosphate synthase
MQLIDGEGRTINYLRLSVTDRCNHRCVYCMPESGVELLPHEKLLRLEELAELTGRFVSLLGISKVRLTGGEPLVRRNVVRLVEMLAGIPGLDDLAMSTNGSLLAEKARALFDAGLRRVNVSVDSLDPERFRRVSWGGELARVLEGLDAARDVGYSPIKVNTVLLPDFHEEAQLVEWGNREGYLVRFIELMPNFYGFRMRIKGEGVKEAGILDRLAHRFTVVKEPIRSEDERGNHVHRYRIPDRNWVFEVIPGVSAPFCAKCNRLRLDSQGALRYCLYSRRTLQLRGLLQASDDEFTGAIKGFVMEKKGRTLDCIGSNMSAIGG